MTTVAQISKAAELIEDGAVTSFGRGLYVVVGSNGVDRYIVNAADYTCTCPAGQHGRACYHLAAVRMLTVV